MLFFNIFLEISFQVSNYYKYGFYLFLYYY